MLSDELAHFVTDLSLRNVPTDVRRKACLHLLDALGILAAASTFDEVKPMVRLVKRLGGPDESSVMGQKTKVGATNAVLANAVMLHANDFDDTHLPGHIHLSATAVPTALALGEKGRRKGSEVLESIIAGYEIGSRLGMAAGGELHARGFHPTSVMGTFVATSVAGKLLDLSKDELVAAYGICGSFSSGIMQALLEGVWVKPLHPAWAAHGGMMAAMMAKEGFDGPKQVIEGKQGVFGTFLYGNEVDYERVTNGLGVKWETMNISFKPYPSCHATHSSAELMLQLRKEGRVDPGDVKEITFYTPKLPFDLGLFDPTKTRPATPYAAKFSLPYVAAVALANGKVGIWDFTEKAIKNEKVLELAAKINGCHDPELDDTLAAKNGIVPIRANVKTTAGVRNLKLVDHKGSPSNPMTEREVLAKFKDNARLSPIASCAADVADMVLNLEKHDFGNIMTFLR